MQKVYYSKTQSGIEGLFTNGLLAMQFTGGCHSVLSDRKWHTLTLTEKKEFCQYLGFEFIESTDNAEFKVLYKLSTQNQFTPLMDEPQSSGFIACFKAQNNLSYDAHKNSWLDNDEFCANETFEYQFINLNM